MFLIRRLKKILIYKTEMQNKTTRHIWLTLEINQSTKAYKIWTSLDEFTHSTQYIVDIPL